MNLFFTEFNFVIINMFKNFPTFPTELPFKFVLASLSDDLLFVSVSKCKWVRVPAG